MNNSSITLTDILNAREARLQKQKDLLETYNLPLISFMLNIPGPQKTKDEYEWAFEEGIQEIEITLETNHINIKAKELYILPTGYEYFAVVNEDGYFIKQLMTTIENGNTLGRIFDIDVLDKNGKQISRKDIGMSGRKCLLCDQPAHQCSRSRNHSVDQLLKQIHFLITEHRNMITNC